jgi:hypothetical protein
MPPNNDRLADPGSSPRQSFAGEARRERPLHDWHDIGPWAGAVAVTPIELAGGMTIFEVSARWGHGDDHGKPDVPGLEGQPCRLATDVVAAEDVEHARAVAMAAVDELRKPERPELRKLARRFGGPLAAG